jgi:hypothetical protein
VIDESNSAFVGSPFGMPNTAVTMGGAQCPGGSGKIGALQVGCWYYLYGPNMQSYSPSAPMLAGWQGQLLNSSGHRVGSQVSPAPVLTTTPHPYTSTSTYYLEPVFDPVSLQVVYYAVFLPVSSNPNYGVLVNTIPVPATSVVNWSVLNQGAVSIKLEQ